MADDDSKAVQDFLLKAGAKTDCEICSQNQWISVGMAGDDFPSLKTSLPITGLGRYPSMGGSMAAYVFICGNCGNIRLHARAIVDASRGGGAGRV
jgi:hypothetical protein